MTTVTTTIKSGNHDKTITRPNDLVNILIAMTDSNPCQKKKKLVYDIGNLQLFKC